MKKYLLFLIVFIASGMAGSMGEKSSQVIGDFFYMHPQNTTSSGLVEIADTVISKSLVVNDAEVTCMAKNIFYEAAVESTAGKLAVAHVTLNRVDSQRFPNTVCEVVYEGPHYTSSNGIQLPRRDRCQFSWYCDGLADVPKERLAWKISLLIARAMLKQPGVHITQDGEPWVIEDFLHGATHYHNLDVAPYWNRNMLKVMTIGDHIFYIDPLGPE